MPYNYLVEKQKIFTDEGQRKFTRFRDKVFEIVKLAGCIREQEASKHADMGDTWTNMAFIDRMVEMGDLVEVNYGDCAGQHRIFTKK